MDITGMRVKRVLARVMQKYAIDPKNPWALAHALLPLERDPRLKNGKRASAHIVSKYLKFRKVGKFEIPYFPGGTFKNRIEPHKNMYLKIFLQIGVPLDRTFQVGQRKVTLRQILRGAMLSFPANPKGKTLAKMAWTFELLYKHLPPSRWIWVNAKGKRVVFPRILWRALHYLDRQTTFLRVLKNRGVKRIPKRRQYIYSETCGGFHLIQGLARWMGHPRYRKRLKPLLDAQIELIFYRINGEIELYMHLLRTQPKYRLLVLIQQLKFLGHALETLALLHKWGLFSPNTSERRRIRQSLKLLYLTVLIIERSSAYRKLDSLKKTSYQHFLDLVGDSAHALHAILLLERAGLYRRTRRKPTYRRR